MTSQFGEDDCLRELLGDPPSGFYVDVGAGHPSDGSVTHSFWARGWHGILIEPNPELFGLLAAGRPGDVCLPVACGDRDETGELRVYDGRWGFSTISPATQARHAALPSHPYPVRVRRLDSILAEHDCPPISFLCIDVEGHEAAVLAGTNLARWQPAAVVIEACHPGTDEPAWQAWEPLLADAGYRHVRSDPVNRFYLLTRPRAQAVDNPVETLSRGSLLNPERTPLMADDQAQEPVVQIPPEGEPNIQPADTAAEPAEGSPAPEDAQQPGLTSGSVAVEDTRGLPPGEEQTPGLPNPAFFAQPGEGSAEHQLMDYPEATPESPSPHSDHGAGDAETARIAEQRAAARETSEGDDEAGPQPGKTGATGEEQLLATPNPALDTAPEGSQNPEMQIPEEGAAAGLGGAEDQSGGEPGASEPKRASGSRARKPRQ